MHAIHAPCPCSAIDESSHSDSCFFVVKNYNLLRMFCEQKWKVCEKKSLDLYAEMKLVCLKSLIGRREGCWLGLVWACVWLVDHSTKVVRFQKFTACQHELACLLLAWN